MLLSRNCAIMFAAAVLLATARAAHAQLDPNAFTSLGTLNHPSGALTINTDTLTITGAVTFTGVALSQNGGPQVAVFDFDSITRGSAATVTLTGSRPLALLSRGNATIQTALNAPLSNSQMGAFAPILGGYAGGFVSVTTNGANYLEFVNAGAGPGGGGAAGGGGHGGKGGSTSEGVGGLPYGNLFHTLQGGSGGGVFVSVGDTEQSEGLGGAGGGAIEVVAAGTLLVANVFAGGHAADRSTSGNNAHSGAGGGAGGGILLSGGAGLTLTGSLDARGGDAASTIDDEAGGGGGGRIALSGLSSYVLGSNPFSFNLNGGNSGNNNRNGSAGVVTVDALTTTINGGTSITLTGDPIVSVPGSVSQTSPTIEAYARHDLSVTGNITLGANNAFQRLDAAGNNITTLFLTQGTFDLNGYSETLDQLSESIGTPSLVKLPAGSTLTVGVGGGSTAFVGQFTGAGSLVKAGSGTWTLSGTSPNFTGPTTVTGGVLTINGPQALQSSTVTLAGGGLSMGFVADAVLGALAGTGNVSLTGLGFNSLTVGGNNSSTTFAGNISGSPPGGLIKAGTGAWTLIGTNTQTGPFKIQAGTVLIGSTAALSAAAPVTVSTGATLDLNGYNYGVTSSNPLTVQGALRLGVGLSVAASGSANYNGGTISNGFLLGAGTHTLTGGATLSGVTTASGVTINQNGPASVINFTNNGQFNNAAGQSLTWSNGTNTSAGRLTVGGTVTASDFISGGVVTINGGGAINNSGSNLILGGGSRTTINSGGAINLSGGTTIELNGGLLVNNGMITGTTDVNFGSLAKGTGTYGLVNVGQGGIYAPGNSPGIVTAAAVTFDPTAVSGAPVLQIELAGTAPGTQFDQLHVTGQLSLGGVLQVLLISGFSPASGNAFDILDWGTITGTFSSLQLPGLNAPLGWDTSRLYTNGTLSVTATLRGDWNRDGQVTAADIPAMLAALTDLNAYKSTNLLTDAQLAAIGDFDSSGSVTNRDIQGLLDLVASQGGIGSVAAVPEPTSWLLLVFGLLGLGPRRSIRAFSCKRLAH